MRKRKHKKIFTIAFIFSTILIFFCMSTAYSLLNQNITVSGRAVITKNESNGADFIKNVSTEEDGIKENADGSFIFVGEDSSSVNNCIEMPEYGEGGKFLWRILSADAEGNIKIIRDRDESLSCAFAEEGNADDWPNTTAYQTLQTFYQQYLAPYSDIIVQNPEWLLTEAKKPNPTTITVVGTFTNSPIGIIRNDEIASSSNNGLSGNTVSSWLNNGYQWTMTSYTNSPDKAWRVNDGKFMNSKATSGNNTVVRPIIYLKASTRISEGSGTELDPFVVIF